MVRQPFHRALYSLELCLGSARISPELQRYGGRAPDGRPSISTFLSVLVLHLKSEAVDSPSRCCIANTVLHFSGAKGKYIGLVSSHKSL